MKTFTIYKLLNEATGKTYTGVTGSIGSRVSQHFRELKKGIHSCKAMQADYNTGHHFEIVVVCTSNDWFEAQRLEGESIDLNTYNVRKVSWSKAHQNQAA